VGGWAASAPQSSRPLVGVFHFCAGMGESLILGVEGGFLPMSTQMVSAAAAGTVAVGDLKVNRLGFGAMRITGKGIWGPPADPPAALKTLRRAVELGVNFIDTADSYGPNVSEELIAEALAPYPSGLVIATKGGWERVGPGQWIHNASPKHLEESLHGSLKRLRLERIDVYQLHIPDPAVSFDASMSTLARLREQGKIRHVALSNVTLEHVDRALKIVPIVSVQNRYSFADREWDFLLDYCEKNGIAFLPWAPLGQNRQANDALESAARTLGATPLQVALAWLLMRSAATLPIPGTSSPAHVEENIQAAGLQLPERVFKDLSAVTPPPASLR
jgi:pyridoxine 4-dehydrogenase